MMGERLSRKLFSCGSSAADDVSGIVHWCPGCDEPHVIYTGGRGVTWQWDGNVESPTVLPSVKLSKGGDVLCHYFLKAGSIEFCADCAHPLRSSTVPLPDFPLDDFGG